MYPFSHSLVVGHTAQLNELSRLISEMTGKEQKITRLDFDCKPHEQYRVDTQSWEGQVVTMVIQMHYPWLLTYCHFGANYLRILLHIANGG